VRLACAPTSPSTALLVIAESGSGIPAQVFLMWAMNWRMLPLKEETTGFLLLVHRRAGHAF
jgi:hypothetical protein